jgi:hypothetical protein
MLKIELGKEKRRVNAERCLCSLIPPIICPVCGQNNDCSDSQWRLAHLVAAIRTSFGSALPTNFGIEVCVLRTVIIIFCILRV